MDIQKIGAQIRSKRLEQDLSISKLSKLSAVSSGTISQIETGKVSPNLLTLKALCDALNLPVFSLFLENNAEHVHLVRREEQQKIVRNMSDGKPLMESFIIQGRHEMYAALIDIPSHADSGEYAHHGGEEFVFVLRGCVVYDLESVGLYELHIYDTLYYANYIGHRWINRTDEPAQIMLVSTSPYNF